LRARVRDVQTARVTKKIGIASAIWGSSILLSRLIGMVREAVIGRTLGGSSEADVYFAAFGVPDFLNYLLAGGALSIVFIPIFGAYLERGEEERGWAAFSSIASFLILLLAALTAVIYALMPELVSLVVRGFDAAQRAELVALSRIILPAQIFHVVGGLLSAALQARDRHVVPALAPLVYTACIIAGGLIGGPSAGAYGFAWGVLAGSVLGPFGLPLAACMRARWQWKWRFDLGDADLRLYLARSLPIMLGFSIVVVDDWFLRREGSLLGEGAVATLTYAKNLMKVPMGVFGLAAGVAAYPALARMAAEKRTSDMRCTLAATARNLLLLSFAAQAVLTVCGEDLATLVYGRRRISPEQLHEIGACIALVSIGLSAWSAQTLIARGFYALGNTWLPALVGTCVAIAAYPAYVLARGSLGTYGLALASSAAVIVYVAILAVLLRRALAREAVGDRAAHASPAGNASLAFLARSATALCASVGAGVAMASVFPRSPEIAWLAARASLNALVALLVFAAVARALGITELGDLLRPLKRRVGLESTPLSSR
jgi:putative peptidoglycan lipid II flippase